MSARSSQLPAEPTLSVCGATIDETEHLTAVENALQQAGQATLDPEARARCIARYFGPSGARCSSRIDAVAVEYCSETNPRCCDCPLRFHCDYAREALTKRCADAPVVADLFCGAGGLSLGFERVGFRAGLAVDNDYWSVFTYRYNRPGTRAHCETFHAGIAEWLDEHATLPYCDVVAAGVPCQPFSSANQQRQAQDLRQDLFEQLFRTVDRIVPKVVVIENVSGFRHVGRRVEESFAEHGYAAGHVVLNAWEYGLPQRRKRLFYLGFSQAHFADARARVSALAIAITRAKSSTRFTLRDAIGDLPGLEALRTRNAPAHEDDATGRALQWHGLGSASEFVRNLNGHRSAVLLCNHKARFNNDRDIEIFRRLEQGENSLAPQIAELMPYRSRNHIFKDKYYRLRYDDPSRTITAHMRWDCNSYIHPCQARGLTAREAARVQGFPDDYMFTGTFQRLYQQIGNAVPPVLAGVLGSSIRSHIE